MAAAAPPDISVVVPTFNRAPLIPDTLRAIQAQSFPARELIVVDDGSSDDTESVVRAVAPRAQYVRIANGGDMVAKNTGTRRATGTLVAFCDSDDLWQPEFLATMAAAWQAEPALKVAYSDFRVFRSSGFEQRTKFDAAPADFWQGERAIGPDCVTFDRPIVDKIVRYQPFFPSCMVVDRAFFLDGGGWDEEVSRWVGCDFSTALRMAEHAPFGIVKKPLVGIRKHDSNFSGDLVKMLLGDARILDHVLAKRPSLAPYRPQMLASAVDRRRQAFDAAFARHDLDHVAAIYALLPPDQKRVPSVAIKRLVSALPGSLARGVAALLLRAGSAKSGAA